MRICLLSPYDLSLEGGVNKHVLNLARCLREAGDEVEVMGPASGDAPDAPNVTCFSGVVSIQGNESDNRIAIFARPWQVAAYMRRHRFDVLHVHEPFVPMLPFYAVWLAPDLARVATFHRYSEVEGRATRITRRALSPFLDSFQRGIAVSEAAARYARVAWDRPLAVIPNGADVPFFAPDEGTPPPVGARGPLRLLFVGQWTDRRKGLPVLLDAVKLLAARGVDVALDVVGKGDPRIPPPEGLPGVTFHGRVPETALRERLHRCDALVAPSMGSESFGMILVEGMAAGRPVVCSDIEGYRQVAEGTGILTVEPGDAGALAAALERLAKEAGLGEQAGRRNREAAQRYDWRRVAERVREEYVAAMAGRGRGGPAAVSRSDPSRSASQAASSTS